MFYRVGLRSQWSVPVEFRVIVSLVIGLVATSFAPIFIRLSEGELSPYATIFNRFWIATVVLSVWHGFSILRSQQSVISPLQQHPNWMRIIGLLLAMGTLLSSASMLWAWSLTQITVANSVMIQSLSPLFTAFWGWLFLKRQFDRNFLIGMAIAVGGTVMLGLNDITQAGGKFQGDLLSLFSALLFGAYPLVVECLKTQLTAKAIVNGGSAVGMLVALPIVLISGNQLFPDSINGWCSVLSLALICQVFGLGLLVSCLNDLSVGFLSICQLLTPIISSIEAWIIFDEILTLDHCIRFSCVFVGIYFTLLSHSTLKNSESSNSPLSS
jgi:drug/metabolite transporter (DMT)-like permease